MASLGLLAGCSSNDAGGANPGNGQAGGDAAGGGLGGDRATGGAVTGSGGSPAAGGTATIGGASAAGGSSSGGMQHGAAGAGGASSGGSSSMAGASAGGAGPAVMSDGCNKASTTLKNSTSNSNPTPITISVSGTDREYAIRWPSNYDNSHAYRLILDLHGYGGSYREAAGEDYFGLWTPSKDTTIFVALSAVSVDWRNGDNVAYAEAVLKAVEADLCIDTSRIMLEGFSQGAAEVWQLACSLPGVFRAAVGHSGGGVTAPSTCKPIPYLGSGGLQENPPATQTNQTDPFAQWNGCTVATLPKAPSGGHACTNYTGCPATAPVRWCNYDG
ncbi:MAG TPA: hypothetical protein VF395_06285, partial [Polyangiaceae bacterium]